MTHDSRHNPAQEEHPFAQYVRILGKGKTGTRSLEHEEARHAFGMILRGEVEELQLGAFLMLLRVKEETGDELAGFVQACRDNMAAPGEISADLDWSSYAGKKHQHPWFLLSALLLAENGYRVFIHGSDGHTPGRLYSGEAMAQLGLPVAGNWDEAGGHLANEGICYLSLAHFCPALHNIMQLKPILGLRSPVNTLARMFNPLGCRASIQSIFHPAYGELHRATDELLGQQCSLVFKGDSGEVEIKPHAETRLMHWHEGRAFEQNMPRRISGRVASVDQPDTASLQALWRGETSDDYGEFALMDTAAAALTLLQAGLSIDEARKLAAEFWHQRDQSRLG